MSLQSIKQFKPSYKFIKNAVQGGFLKKHNMFCLLI